VTRRAQVALLLDEMFSPVIAGELRRRGFDVIAVAADPQLRSMTDKELFIWAGEKGRRIVTENVKDLRPLPASGRPGRLAARSHSGVTRPRKMAGTGPPGDNRAGAFELFAPAHDACCPASKLVRRHLALVNVRRRQCSACRMGGK